MFTLIEADASMSCEVRAMRFTSVDKAETFLAKRGYKKYGKNSTSYYKLNSNTEYLLLEEASMSIDPE